MVIVRAFRKNTLAFLQGIRSVFPIFKLLDWLNLALECVKAQSESTQHYCLIYHVPAKFDLITSIQLLVTMTLKKKAISGLEDFVLLTIVLCWLKQSCTDSLMRVPLKKD